MASSVPLLTILPNARNQFIDSNGQPYVGGTVGFYIPGTLTPKTTWQDGFQQAANTNPVVLDAQGTATIWGTGLYRQILKDKEGNTIWDEETLGSQIGGQTVPVSQFGAYPDGTDAYPGIQLAMNYAISSGINAISFGAGTYVLRTGHDTFYSLLIPLVTGFTMIGLGKGVTTIQNSTGVSQGVLQTTEGSSNIIIRGITFDANTPANSSNGKHGVRPSGCAGITFQDFAVLNASGYGMGWETGHYQDVLIDNFEINSCALDGIDFKNFDSLNQRIKISNGTILNAGGDISSSSPVSIDIRGPGTVIVNVQTAITIIDGRTTVGIRCRSDDADQGDGGKYSVISNCTHTGTTGVAAFDSQAPSVTFTGCSAILGTSGTNGFLIDATDVVLTGCQTNGGSRGFWSRDDRTHFVNCIAVGGAGEGFRIEGANDITLASCFAYTNLYGFRLVSGSTNARLVMCNATGNTTADWFLPVGAYQSFMCDITNTPELFYLNGAAQFAIGSVASATNHIQINGSAGATPTIAAVSTANANIDLALVPKGTGLVQIGPSNSTADAPVTGYISVKDTGGVIRKLATIT